MPCSRLISRRKRTVKSNCPIDTVPHRHSAAFAKFRCGIAPLSIETGRFENKPLQEPKCPFCDKVETESHVLLDCDSTAI